MGIGVGVCGIVCVGWWCGWCGWVSVGRLVGVDWTRTP